MRKLLPFGLALLLAALAGACGSRQNSAVVVVTLEGVRSADLEAAVAGSPGLPAMARLTRSGVWARFAITPSPDAPAAAASIFSGVSVSSHHLSDGTLGRIDPKATLLPEEFRAAGYATAAFIGSRSIMWPSGLARGFEHFQQALGEAPTMMLAGSNQDAARGWDAHSQRRDATETVQDALRWLRITPKNRFVWIHLAADPGEPVLSAPVGANEAPALIGRSASETAASLTAIDRAIELLMQGVEDLQIGDRTVIAIVGTSGSGRGEHGEWTTGLGLYDSTVRVPFILTGAHTEPRVIDEPVSTTWMNALLRQAGGLKNGSNSSSAKEAAEPSAAPVLSVTYTPLSDFCWPVRVLARTRDLAVITTPGSNSGTEVYDLSNDPGEERNLNGPGMPDPSGAQALVAWLASANPLAPDTPVAGPSSACPSPVPPEVQRRVIALLIAAGRAAAEKDGKGAQARLEEALALSPSNPALLRQLSLARRSGGDRDGAMAAWEPLRAVAESSPYAALKLAEGVRDAGKADEAIEILKDAGARTPQNGRLAIHLSDMLSGKGSNDEAVDALKALAAAEPGDPKLQERLGDIYFGANYGYRAAAAYEKVIALGYRTSDVLLKLGDCRLQLKDSSGALELFQEVIASDPSSSIAHLKAGETLIALNREAEASVEYRKSLPSGAAQFDAGMQIAERVGSQDHDTIALMLYSDLAALDPKRFEPHYRVGELFLRQGMIAEAEKAFRYALGLAPNVPALHYQLARVALANKNEAAAMDEVKTLVAGATPAMIAQIQSDPIFTALPEDSGIRKLLAEAAAEPRLNGK